MLSVIESATERWQVLDDRGRLLQGFGSKPEADAFVQGYKAGREDGAMMASHAIDGLGARIGGGVGGA